MRQRLNFSPRPFRGRDSGLLGLWLLNLGLFLAVLVLGWQWYSLHDRNAEIHGRLDGLGQERSELLDQHDDLIEELESLQIGRYRKTIDQFHGVQLAFATHWGRLLDDLGAMLPNDVRIVSLRPDTRSNGLERDRTTQIRLSAEARTKEAQLAFIERMQAGKGFRNVMFKVERYEDDPAAVAFELIFTYVPQSPLAPASRAGGE